MNYEAIFFDFDGVLCKDYFYNNLPGLYDDVYGFIQSKIFRGNSDIPDRRMRNRIKKDEVNAYISVHTGIDYRLLQQLFEESVRNMKIDQHLLNVANQLKKYGIPIVLVTNNMDVFNETTIPYNRLDEVFPIIVNSCDYGTMKHEQEGLLFDKAMERLGLDDYHKVLLIDDSAKARGMFEKKGGETFPYTTFDEFYLWGKEHLDLV